MKTQISIKDYLLALAHFSDLKPKEKCKLFVEYGKSIGENIDLPLEWTERVRVSKEKRRKWNDFLQTISLNKMLKNLRDYQVHYVTILDKNYPTMLKHIYEPPLVLFYKGNVQLLHTQTLGVVGARLATNYGKGVCKKLLPKLIENNVTIVSGLAKGIDTSAHSETINHGGHTIAVIGTGIDQYYPRENRDLQMGISKNHLLISEYPLHTRPRKSHFPYRNRIIAGLSYGVLVIEAKQRSGSLITARQALEEGRDVFSVPGSILNSFSIGTNELIKLGAKPILEADDILAEWSNRFI